MRVIDNKLIADFMGFVESPTTNKYWTKKSQEGFGIGELVDLQFDTDWSWLMEVVERIENTKVRKLSFNFNIQKDRVSLYYIHTSEPKKQIEMWLEFGQKTKIENAYKIVVEFIKWHNNESNN